MLSALRISLLGLTLLGAVSGCVAPAPTTSGVTPAPQVTTAWFAAPPAGLIEAARSACAGPGEEFVQPRPGVVQCRLFMEPRTTAAVILKYDGDIKALPQLVISMHMMKAPGGGHLVTGCAFLKVPHPGGRVSRIVQNDRAVATKLGKMLGAVGGQPVRDAPPEAAKRCFAL